MVNLSLGLKKTSLSLRFALIQQLDRFHQQGGLGIGFHYLKFASGAHSTLRCYMTSIFSPKNKNREFSFLFNYLYCVRNPKKNKHKRTLAELSDKNQKKSSFSKLEPPALITIQITDMP